MYDMSVTLLVTKLLICKLEIDIHSWNMWAIFSTLLVLKLFKFILFTELIPLNKYDISTTFSVFASDVFNSNKDKHFSSKWDIFVTLIVLNELKENSVI